MTDPGQAAPDSAANRVGNVAVNLAGDAAAGRVGDTAADLVGNTGADRSGDTAADLVGRLLAVLDQLEVIARRLHPPALGLLVAPLRDDALALQDALAAFTAVEWPERMEWFRAALTEASGHALTAAAALLEAGQSPDGLRSAYRALRSLRRSLEALYPLAAFLPTVNAWFVEPGRRADAALLARLAAPEGDVGVHHFANERGSRGGYSVYVPESCTPASPSPLIMALHGGAGHGRQFLWSWVREARSRGAIVVAPTAPGDTWAIMEPEADALHLAGILQAVEERWRVDTSRRLLTGMSDGGTFTLVSGLQEDCPFTHLGPVAASFHPLLLAMADPARMRGLPVYLVHGVLDWMFPVSVARSAHRALTAAGADVLYREIAELSHVYPRDENTGILDWLARPRP